MVLQPEFQSHYLRSTLILLLLASGCREEVTAPPTGRKAEDQAAREIAKEALPANNEPPKGIQSAREVTTVDAELLLGPMPPRVVPPVTQQNTAPLPGMPKVLLSETQAKKYLIQVGQEFPTLSLPDASGQSFDLSKLRGRYTLILVWSASEPASVEELADLGPSIHEAYKNVGLKVVAIHTTAGKNTSSTETLQELNPPFKCLNDTQGELLNKLGKGGIPRTFLLDAAGKVLWFDIEYSRTTRRQLQQALQAVLQEI